MDISHLPEEVSTALKLYYTHHFALPALWKNRPTVQVGVRILEGYDPFTMGQGLTRREAAQWCNQDTWATPEAWLWAQHRASWPDAPTTLKLNGGVPVVRWLLGLNEEQRTAFLRTKRIDGEEVPVYGWTRLDELTKSDLSRGVEATFALAEDRAALEQWKGPNELAPTPKWASKLPEGVEVITTFTRLVQEGREMRHCVANYATNIANHHEIILAIEDRNEHRSTAQILPNGTLHQHEGRARRTPTAECVALVKQAMEIIEYEKWRIDPDSKFR